MPQTDQMLSAAAARAEQLAASDLSPRPGRKLAVLTCMDTRIDVLPMLGLNRGDAHIIRNAGGLATDDTIRSLSVSQRLLGTEEIIVIMHRGCGLHRASDSDFADQLAADNVEPRWQLGAFEEIDATLHNTLRLLRSSRELPHRDQIRGLIFDPETGMLADVEPEIAL